LSEKGKRGRELLEGNNLQKGTMIGKYLVGIEDLSGTENLEKTWK